MSSQFLSLAELPPRSSWLRSLLSVPRDEVLNVVAALRARDELSVSYLQAPQSGLSMLRMAEPCLGDHYHVGEVPVSISVVQVKRDGDGATWDGAAQAMTDDDELITTLAIADAMLAHASEDFPELVALVAHGWSLANTEDATRATVLHRTSVRFDLLETSADDDDDENQP